MVDFLLTPRQEELRSIAKKFAIEVMIPSAEKADREPDPAKAFDWNVVREGSRLGLRTLTIPKEFGGEGANVETAAMIGEQLAYGDLGMAVAFDQTWKILTAVCRVANESQRKRWLPLIVEDDTCLMGICSTEPTAGSENILPYQEPGKGMQMRAEKKGDVWVLNGTKRYISNGGLAKYYMVRTRNDPDGPLRTSLTSFMVSADAPGFEVTEVWDKLGQRCVQNGTLQFTDVEIPDSDRVGEVGNAAQIGTEFLLGYGSNIQAGATVLGVAQRAYDLSVQYAFEREQAGGPIINHQIQRTRLARMAMQITAARAYIMQSAWSAGRPDQDPMHASLCKVFASEVAVHVCQQALELWAAAGYMRKNPLEKLIRDAQSFLHSDGTNDVLALKAGNYLMKPDPSDLVYSKRAAEAAAGS
ncbi:MAG: acyl-CoA dehydrogenase family protein [Alphaproteobacteria bacterium]